MGFLKFALICIDFLAWPVIALGYPLFASIRAVEIGSKYHMKKLVIYWTLFSLISLFEFAFVKIIEWIPFWSGTRLIAISWLVILRFNGACCAYQSLVRPVLYVNIQAVIDKFYKPKEEKPSKRETFLDVVEKYIKQNGSEALEKLIASKNKCKESENSQRDSQVLEPEEKNAAGALKLYAQPNTAAASAPKGKDAAAKDKETTAQETSAGNRRPQTPPIKKPHQEWTHKHNSNCKSLKSSKLGAKDTERSPSPTGNSNKVGEGSERKSCEKTQERVQPQAPTDQKNQAKPKQDGGTNQMFIQFGSICAVELPSDVR